MYARFGFLSAFALAAVLAACGGGGGGGTPPPTAPPPTPAGPTVNVTFGGSATTASIPIAPGATYGGTMTFPAGSGAGVMVASTAVPSSVPVLNLAARSSAAPNAKTKVRPQATGAPYTAVSYITLTASSAVSLSGTISASPSSGYDVAYYTAQGFWVTLPVSGQLTISANGTAYFAVYTGGTLPSPNPDGCVGLQGDMAGRSASMHAQAVGVQPTAGTYTYTGTYSETMWRASPCPIPTTTAAASVAITVTMSPGPSNATYEKSTETDTFATETVTENTSALVEATSAPAAQSFAELSESTTDEVGDVVTTSYSTPLTYAIGAPLPYTSAITNGPPSTVNATLADGTTTARTYSGTSGAYTETDTIAGLPNGANQNVIVNNGTSGYYFLQSPNFSAGGANTLRFAYSAPSGGMITFTEYENGTQASSSDGTVLTTFSIPQWWTQTSTYADVTTGGAVTTLPSQCAAAPGTGTFYPFTRTIAVVDPVLGYVDTRTVTSYVAQGYNGSGTTVGPVCVTINDVEQIYYDYFLDTPYSAYLTGQLLQTDTIAEAYWFSSTPAGVMSVRRQSENPGAIPGLAASISAREAAIDFRRSIQRTQRIENFARNVGSHTLGGVK